MQVPFYKVKGRGGWAGGWVESLEEESGHSDCYRIKTTPALVPTPLPRPGCRITDKDEEMNQMKGKNEE